MFETLWLLSDGAYALWNDGQLWRMGDLGGAGAVYRAKVERLAPALGGVFVNLGQEKALLPTVVEYTVGDTVIVQVQQAAKASKLAVVTDRVGLEGRYLVYLPNAKDVRVSHRMSKADKTQLLTSLHLPAGGYVVRSAAASASPAAIAAEAEELLAKWNELPRNVGYLYEPKPDYDGLVAQANEVLCDDAALCVRLGKARYCATLRARYEALHWTAERVVTTQEGVSLVFDHTEAAWVVDVNSGRYLPALSAALAAENADRIAAKELVRQLSLRNITGMVLVDFVSLPKEKGAQLLAYLQSLAQRYDPRLHVVDYTKLGIVEMTRAE